MAGLFSLIHRKFLQKVGDTMIFYDFEVFAYDWLVVLIDLNAKQETVIINDPDKLKGFYESHKETIWAGYNSRHYDQFILKGILCGFNPKKVNDWIILDDKPGYRFSSLFRNFPLINYDVMPNPPISLKALEAFMGHSIKETTVPFDIDRPLTEAELAETVKYCRHDVEETVEVWVRNIAEFNTTMFFVNHFHLGSNSIGKTKAQLAAEILGGNGKGKSFDDEFDFPILDCLRLKKYRFVADWYKNPVNHDYGKAQENITVAGVPHTFAWGGGHGAIPKYHAHGIFLVIDVTAYYPSLQKQFKIGYRVMDHPENFEFIHDSNIEFKRKGDKKARQPFKIMDNAISGQMKQPQSALYDPMSNNTICINGQLLLLDLVEHLEPYCKLVQNNTDGIIVQLADYDRDFEKIDDVVWEWEQRTGMKMDFDTFMGDIYQKDVNNYFLVDRETGAVKAKGAYVKKLSDLDYDLPIVNRAISEYFSHKTTPEETIMGCGDLRDFQKVVKVSSKYECALYSPVITMEKIRDEKGRSKNVKRFSGGEVQTDKTFRVFASTDRSKGGLFKVSGKVVKGRKKNPEKFGNTPEHCFIINDDVTNLPVPDELDRQYYIDLAWKRLKDYGVDRETGAVKAKGAYVKKLSDLDYDLPIVNRAISEYFSHKTTPEETIMGCGDLRDFQKVVKVSSKYECALYSPVITMEKIRDEKGRSKNVKRFSGGEVQTDKTFRVFASTDRSKGGLFKVSGKVVKGRKKNPEKFGNTPEHCFIINDDVTNLPVPDELDRQYYIDLAWKRLKDYGVDREGGGI